MNMTHRAGQIAPFVYLVAVVAGGATSPQYNHLSMPISALMASYAGPWWINVLFSTYNALLALFALGCHQRGIRFSLLGSAAVGLAMLALPMDMPGTAVTGIGMAHLTLAGLAALLSMTAIASGAISSRGAARFLSWLALGVVLVSGALTAIGTGQNWPIAGLLERLTIGTFLIWVAGYARTTS